MSMIYIILDNEGGELAREPVAEDGGKVATDAIKEAIERLVADTGFFSIGDTIKVVQS